jgi:hypothetical protein
MKFSGVMKMEFVNFAVVFIIIAVLMCCVMPVYFNSFFGKKKQKLKNSYILSIPDDRLETAVTEWLFSQTDEKGEVELSVVKAMPEPCRNVYAVYVVTGEVCSGGFAKSFKELDSFFFSQAICGFLAMKADNLAEILETACAVAGKFIKENGRENITDIALDEKIPTLNHEFCSCEDMINLSDKIVSYIKENSEYFGD